MAFWDIFTTAFVDKNLTEPEVIAMEGRAKQAQTQLKLTRRYVKARGIALTSEAETRYVYRLGETITNTQLKVIQQNGNRAIAGAKETAKISTQNKINNYAQKLLKSGGGKDAK
ncbi:hypothetical protein [[Limnothrix rosea] IAM M-220]|uniref:hypothetical protein n=1 Tax=[Limnothrix rosea] IAM M-220 TaxID=454133 RepID=UPI0009629CA5|nr:hypothetical protein [[Limnothrix rosea] IAM M-220]OKH12313.1 hypothetical protein NIES208_16330 [[Limnothrix rosea] IAM M-220]